MPYCAVPGCVHGSGRGNLSVKAPKFHRFPQTKQEASLWWQAIHRDGLLEHVKDPRVCSVHFPKSAYGCNGRLLNSAIPSLAIPLSHPTKTPKKRDSSKGERASCTGTATPDSVPMNVAAGGSPSTVSVGDPGPPDVSWRGALSGSVASGLFTEQQAHFLATGVRPCPWDEPSVYQALLYRCNTSRKTYQWLRKKGHPLPCLTTLQSWLSNFRPEPDICEQQTQLLQEMLATRSEMQRQSTLMFDEMDISRLAAYDHARDQMFGPHRHLQVIMLTSIFSDWKLPILFCFDRSVDEALLMATITSAEAAGARVAAVVSDRGPHNQALWTELNIAPGHTSFVNPADSRRRVWVLSDLPHGMKCLRNNLLDHDLTTSRGCTSKKSVFEKVVAVNRTSQSDYQLMHKLKASHVHVKGMSRQKVRPAMQLVSSSTADCMRYFLTNEDEDYTELARVVQLFDNLCDILNSGSPADPKELRRGYRATEQQEAVMDEAAYEVLKMRFGAAKSMFPFQKAMLVTIESVRGLLRDMRAAFGDGTYILTRRLSQDQLEGLFGMVRGRSGSNSNPNPVDAMASLRLITILFGLNCGASPLKRPSHAPESARRGSATETEADADADVDADDVPSPTEQLRELREEAADVVPPEVAADLQEFGATPADAGDVIEPPVTTAGADRPVSPDPDLESLLQQFNDARRPGTSRAAASTSRPEASAMAYVCGYVASKSRDPSLGLPSSQSEDGPTDALWVRVRSEGGLTVPTEDFYRTFKEMDAAFEFHHALEPNRLSRRPKVIADFLEVLNAKFPSVPASARKTFARTRTFMRLRAVNSRYLTDSMEKRAAKKRKQVAT